MIDLRLLQTLRVLRAYGTVHATAEVLHLSPSAVSAQLRQLAHEVGVDLLERDGRRIRLTPAAHALSSHADTLIAQWEAAQSDVGRAGSGVLRICGFTTSFAPLLAPAAELLAQANPRLDIHLDETGTVESYRRVLTGQADVAVLTPLPGNTPMDDQRFDQRPLLDDPQDLVTHSGHPFAQRGDITLLDAASEPWIAPHEDQEQLMVAACTAAGFAPRITHHADAWPAVLAMVAHGLGVCLLPRMVPLDGHPDVTRIPIAGTPSPLRRVLICVRRGSRDQPTIADALTTLRHLADHAPA